MAVFAVYVAVAAVLASCVSARLYVSRPLLSLRARVGIVASVAVAWPALVCVGILGGICVALWAAVETLADWTRTLSQPE